MNSLNLRVSAVKSGENVKKNSEIRASLVTLPAQYSSNKKAFVEEFRNANTVPQQVNAIKKIFSNAKSEPNKIRFLADLLFDSAVGHPVRNQITKLFTTSATNEEAQNKKIVSALKQTINCKLNSISKLKDDHGAINLCIMSLSGCFNNFPCGLQALSANYKKYVCILCDSMSLFMNALSGELSPSKTNEYYLFIHNIIRSLLSCVQECTTIVQGMAEKIKLFVSNGFTLTNNEKVPMEIRLNIVLLILQIGKQLNIYSDLLNFVISIENAQMLPFSISVLNSFTIDDFYNYSPLFLKICTKVVKLGDANATMPNILIYSFRALLQFTRHIQEIKSKDEANLKSISATMHSKLALRNIFLFANSHLEHYIDTVRHLCRDLVREVIQSAKHFDFHQLIDKIYEACNCDRMTLPSKCILLQQSAIVFGSKDVLSKCPRLFHQIFCEHFGREPTVDSVYEKLMTLSYDEKCYNSWACVWLNFLMEIAAKKDDRLAAVEQLLRNVIFLDKRIIYVILEKPELSPSTKLAVLWSVRKTGIKIELFNKMIKSYVNVFRDAMLSSNIENSLMALRVIVETHKTTESLNEFECQNLGTFIDYQSNNPDPAVRHKAFALLKKALARCEIQLIKDYKNREDINLEMEKERISLVFLRYAMRTMVVNLFPGANYSRRWLALSLLQQCLDVCKKLNLNYKRLIPKNSVQRIYSILNDSYEGNKIMACDLLKQLEAQEPMGLIKFYGLPLNKDSIKSMLTSLRPPDSATGTYQLDFFCNRDSNTDTFGPRPGNIRHKLGIFMALKWCLKELVKGLEMAQEDLTRAAKFNPLYGFLYAIRHMLKKVNLRSIANESQWRKLIAELVRRCKEITTVVGPIVNSSSPEGHLPDSQNDKPSTGTFFYDYQSDADDIISVELSSATSLTSSDRNRVRINGAHIFANRLPPIMLEQIQTTPQMILLCAWRTVKEVSLILGDLVMEAPLQSNDNSKGADGNDHNYLLTKKQVFEIGEHFKELLGSTKHRGAFEQVFIGFSSYCKRLWRIDSMDLNVLPMQWLKDMLEVISAPDQPGNEKLCATRRSAGLPYMVQAIVTTELQQGSTNSLNYGLDSLLKNCENLSDSVLEARVHSLNIMRSLFRCSVLNENVGPYVARGLICALNCCDKLNWMERNSATLLYSALITRIFGVQRTKDLQTLDIRNRMTGRIFFTRYPELYDYLLSELNKAVKLIMDGKHALKLHPILVLLSRLYPSSMEGSESNLNIADFVPLISACSCVPDIYTRNLAGKALVALVDKNKILGILLHKCEELVTFAAINETSDVVNVNTLHGNLIQIFHLLKQFETFTPDLINSVVQSLVDFDQVNKLKNFLIIKTTLEILNMILERQTTFSSFDKELVDNLLYFKTNINYIDEFSVFYPELNKCHQNYILHILRLTISKVTLVNYMLEPLITTKIVHLDIIDTMISIILMLLYSESSSLQQCEEEADLKQEYIKSFNCNEDEYKFFLQLSPTSRTELALMLRRSKTLLAQLLCMIEEERFVADISLKCYAILSLMETVKFDLNELITQADKYEDKSPITMCIIRHVQDYGIKPEDWTPILSHALKCVVPSNPDFLRFQGANLLQYIGPHFRAQLESHQLHIIGPYVRLVLFLLMDDKCSIRVYTSSIVLNNLKKSIELCKFVDWSACNEGASSLCKQGVVPTLAQQLFLQNCADMLRESDASDDVLMEIFSLIVDPHLTILPKKGTIMNSNQNENQKQEKEKKQDQKQIDETSKEVNICAEVEKIKTEEEIKVEELKYEENNIEELKYEENKVEALKYEEDKVEEAKSEESKVEGTQSEAIKSEVGQVKENNVDAAKVDKTKDEEIISDAIIIKVEGAIIDAVNDEEDKGDAAKSEVGQIKEDKVEAAKVNKSKDEGIKSDAKIIKVEGAIIHTVNDEEGKGDAAKSEVGQIKEDKVEAAQVDKTKDEERKSDAIIIEVEGAIIDAVNDEEGKGDADKSEVAKVTQIKKTKAEEAKVVKAKGKRASKVKKIKDDTGKIKIDGPNVNEVNGEEPKNKVVKAEVATKAEKADVKATKSEEIKANEAKDAEAKDEKDKNEEAKDEETTVEKADKNKIEEAKDDAVKNKAEGEEGRVDEAKADAGKIEEPKAEGTKETIEDKANGAVAIESKEAKYWELQGAKTKKGIAKLKKTKGGQAIIERAQAAKGKATKKNQPKNGADTCVGAKIYEAKSEGNKFVQSKAKGVANKGQKADEATGKEAKVEKTKGGSGEADKKEDPNAKEAEVKEAKGTAPAKSDASRKDCTNTEKAKVEETKAKGDAGKKDGINSEVAKVEETKAKGDAGKKDCTNTEEVKVEETKAKGVENKALKSGKTKGDSVKQEIDRKEDTNAETSKVKINKSEGAKAKRVKNKRQKFEKTKNEETKAKGVENKGQKSEENKGVSAKQQPDKKDSTNAEKSKFKKDKDEGAKAEKTESDSAKGEAGNKDGATAKDAKVNEVEAEEVKIVEAKDDGGKKEGANAEEANVKETKRDSAKKVVVTKVKEGKKQGPRAKETQVGKAAAVKKAKEAQKSVEEANNSKAKVEKDNKFVVVKGNDYDALEIFDISNEEDASNMYAEPLTVLMDLLIVYRLTFPRRTEVLDRLIPYEKHLESFASL